MTVDRELSARRRLNRIERLRSARPESVEPADPEQAHEQSGTLLLEIIDRVLDKGLVIDTWARVPVPGLGLDLLSLDARAFVASFETYLQYAESVAQTAAVSLPPPSPPPSTTTEVAGSGGA